MFSINDGKEILAFFGYPEVNAQRGEVWRYVVDSNSWIKDATLDYGKFRHAAFPVSGLTC